MEDLSKIKVGETEYNLKDTTARQSIPSQYVKSVCQDGNTLTLIDQDDQQTQFSGGGTVTDVKKNGTSVVDAQGVANITVPTKTSDITNDSDFITNSVNNLANYYLKNETYTKTEVNNLISAIPQFSIQIVESLPTTDISTTTIYLVLHQNGSGNNYYDEYIYINNAWEMIGTTQVDLTGYATETWVNSQIADFLTETQINSLISTALASYYTQEQTNNLLANKENTSNKVTSISSSSSDVQYPSAKSVYDYVQSAIVSGLGGSY